MDKELWDQISKQLESSLPFKKKTWFKKVIFLGCKDDVINLGLHSEFTLQGLLRNGTDEILNTCSEFAGRPMQLNFTVIDDEEEKAKDEEKDAPEEKAQSSSEKPAQLPKVSRNTSTRKTDNLQERVYGETSKKAADAAKAAESHLNPHYTFDNFVVGDNNNFAYNAAKVISKNPGLSYNPCLIYGGVGLGKTHLVQAIGNFIINDNPKMKVIYTTAESFMNELVSSIINKTASTIFKKKYRSADVLLIDDIHFLQDKEKAQEELFHTFNDLTERNKQIVFTCDRPITELKGIADRLRTRFTKGTNVDLQPPLYEMRLAIVQAKCKEMGYNIPPDIQELLCQNIKTNVRDLEGALITLDSFSKLVGKEITKKVALDHIRNFLPAQVLKESEITVDDIIDETCKYFNVSATDVKSKQRSQTITRPRHIAMYIAADMTTRSLSEIGKTFNVKDHTSVKYAIDKITRERRTDEDLNESIENIRKTILEGGDNA